MSLGGNFPWLGASSAAEMGWEMGAGSGRIPGSGMQPPSSPPQLCSCSLLLLAAPQLPSAGARTVFTASLAAGTHGLQLIRSAKLSLTASIGRQIMELMHSRNSSSSCTAVSEQLGGPCLCHGQGWQADPAHRQSPATGL